MVIARQAKDVNEAHGGHMVSGQAEDEHFFRIGQIIGTFKDWKVYMYALVHILGSLPLYSFALNLPSILQVSCDCRCMLQSSAHED